jgi:hypothetical protein
MQQVQREKYGDVLEQRRCFQQLTPAQFFSWSRGNFCVDVDISSQWPQNAFRCSQTRRTRRQEVRLPRPPLLY